MDEYLYRVIIEFDWRYKGDKNPVYAVARSEDEVMEYVGKHLKEGCKIRSVCLLAIRLGINMYHGKPKKKDKLCNIY